MVRTRATVSLDGLVDPVLLLVAAVELFDVGSGVAGELAESISGVQVLDLGAAL